MSETVKMDRTNSKQIQSDIMDVLKRKNQCAFGDLVKELHYTYNDILQNLIELKQNGKVAKMENHRGYYTLTNR